MIQYPFGVGDVVTRVLEAGSGDRHVVLVHGVGSRADRWRRNVDALADAGYHVLALDLPGHGLASKGPQFDYSVAGLSQFLRAFLSAQEISRSVIVGTSLGGFVAAHAACEQPDLVRGLVLVGSIGLVPWGEERRAAAKQRLRDTSREGIERKLRVVVHDPVHVTDDWVAEEVRVNNSPGAAEAFAAIGDYFGSRLDDDLVIDRLTAIVGRFPILLVWGAQEKSVPVEAGEKAHAALEGSQLVLIDGTAHAPYYERPDEFNTVLLGFLASS